MVKVEEAVLLIALNLQQRRQETVMGYSGFVQVVRVCGMQRSDNEREAALVLSRTSRNYLMQ
jgi:hypothetical protein